MKRRYGFLIFFFGFSLLISCKTQEGINISSTPTLYIITSTLPPTPTLQPTFSPIPSTPIPTFAPVEGITTTQVNVRELPMVTADLLGQLNIFTKVEITGKNPGGDWYRINYSPVYSPTAVGPTYTSSGWVNSDYIQVEGEYVIPVITNDPNPTIISSDSSYTQVSQTATTNVTSSLQPFPSTANEDGDSAQAPGVDIDFSPTGARSITYASDVSSPQGDLDDWLRFKPYYQSNSPSAVSVIIKCSSSNGLNIELLQVTQVLQTWENTPCTTTARLLLSLNSTSPYLLKLSPAISNAGLRYVTYVITIQQDN